MGKRRLRGEGSIYQRKSDGLWVGSVTIGYDGNGRQVKKKVYARTAELAREKLEKLRSQAGTRIVQAPNRATLAEWLERRITDLEGARRPNTIAKYRYQARLVNQVAGGTQLRKLTPLQLRSAFASIAKTGKSPSVQQHTYDFLRTSLRDAVELGLMDNNPMALVPRPKGGRVRQLGIWSAEEARRFLEAAQQDRLYALFYLALALGLRRGELLGLTWHNFDGDRLHIRQQLTQVGNDLILGPPKTGRSLRSLYLADDAQEILEAQRKRLAGERKGRKGWNPEQLVFPSRAGTYLQPHRLYTAFNRVIKLAEVPKIRFHDLRRTWVTLARDAGVALEVVADRAGHDSRLTAQIYSEVTEGRRKRAALGMADLLGVGSAEAPHG